MRIIIFLLSAFLIAQPVLCQVKPPTKTEIQAQMLEAVNAFNIQIAGLEKQLVEARKNKEDAETIKGLEEEIAMLKKQVAMMGGLNKKFSGVSEKIFQQAGEAVAIVPRKDSIRINSLPNKILSDSGLYSFIKKIHIDVEKLIPPVERTEAIKIYTETKAQYKSVVEINNAATGCWIYGHWEKALWLAGRACLDSIADPDNLNNYASFLTMIGGEHAALPILQYLNKKYPKNSTVLNNIGQAWFGLGDIPTAKRFLDSATILFPDHSMANLTLSSIYRSQGDSVNAIAALRRSLRNGFTLEKAALLENLGAELEDDDIDFDYPMDDDPLGFEPFLDLFPAVPGSVAETPMATRKWEAFYEAVQILNEKTSGEANEANIRTAAFTNRMMDSGYQQPVLKLHNGHVNFKALRKLPLAIKKKTALSIVDVMHMMANAFHEVTTTRLNELEKNRQEGMKHAKECSGAEAVNNRFMSEAKAVLDEGSVAMRAVYLQNKKKVHNFIKLMGYSATNDYNEGMGKFHEEIWKKNQWIMTYTATFAANYASLKQRPAMFSSCVEEEVPKQTIQLPSFKIPGCTHSESLKLPVGGIKEECNTCTIDESKLKQRHNNLPKGEVQMSSAANSTAQGPQKQESVDPSKTTTIDCNKLGPVKVDRARGIKQQRCTVSSESSSSGFSSTGISVMGGGRLGIKR